MHYMRLISNERDYSVLKIYENPSIHYFQQQYEYWGQFHCVALHSNDLRRIDDRYSEYYSSRVYVE